MSIQAAIELSGRLDTRTQQRIVASAYRWSRGGRIVLMLNEVDRWSVNRLLDGVVAAEGIHVAGVQFCDASDLGELQEAAGQATAVFTSSETLCARLRDNGMLSLRLDTPELLRHLEEASERVSAVARASVA